VQYLYPWIVFVHVLAAFAFVLAHGASAVIAFRLRAEREPARLAVLLELSGASVGLIYSALMVLILAGVAAGLIGNWFAERWIWAALILLALVTVAMLGLAAPYFARLRTALGLPTNGRMPTRPPASPVELAALLDCVLGAIMCAPRSATRVTGRAGRAPRLPASRGGRRDRRRRADAADLADGLQTLLRWRPRSAPPAV
jgi:hypothetical protein